MSSKYSKWIQVLSILLALLAMGQLMFTATLLFLISIILSKSGGYVATICGLIGSLVCLPTAFKIRSHYGNKDETKVRQYDIQTYHRCMLYISLGVQTFCALVCFACLTQNETAEVALTSAITKYQQKFSDKKFLDMVQILFQCCGIYSYEDWAQKNWISGTKQQIFCKHEFNDETFKNVEMSPTAEMNAKYLTAVPYSCCKIETSKPCRNFDLKCSGTKTINSNGCISELNTFITSIICSELIIYLFAIAVVVAILKFFNWEETEIYLNDGDDYSKLEGDDIGKKGTTPDPQNKRVYEEIIHRTRTTKVPKNTAEESRLSKINRLKSIAEGKEDEKVRPSAMDTTTTESKTDASKSTTDTTKSKEEPHKHEGAGRKSMKPPGDADPSSRKSHANTRKSMKPPADASKHDLSSRKSMKPHADHSKHDLSSRKSMKPPADASKHDVSSRKSMKPTADASKHDVSSRKSMKPPADASTRKSMKPPKEESKRDVSSRKSMKPHADHSKHDVSSRKSMKPPAEHKDDAGLRGGEEKSLKKKRSRAGLSVFRRKKKKQQEQEAIAAAELAAAQAANPPVTNVAPVQIMNPAPTNLVPVQAVSPVSTPSATSSSSATPTGSKSILKHRDPSTSSSSSDSHSSTNRVTFVDEMDFTAAGAKTAQLIPSKQEQILITCDKQITLIPTCPTTLLTCQGVPVTPVCKIPQVTVNPTMPPNKPPEAPKPEPPSAICQKFQCSNNLTQAVTQTENPQNPQNPQIIQVTPPNIYICSSPIQNPSGRASMPQQIYPNNESAEWETRPSPTSWEHSCDLPSPKTREHSPNMPKVCPGSAYTLPQMQIPPGSAFMPHTQISKKKSPTCTNALEKCTENYTNFMSDSNSKSNTSNNKLNSSNIKSVPDVEWPNFPDFEYPNPQAKNKNKKKIEDYVSLPDNFLTKSCVGKCRKPLIEECGASGRQSRSSCCLQGCGRKVDRKVSFSTQQTQRCFRLTPTQTSLPENRNYYSEDSDSSADLLSSFLKKKSCFDDIERYYNLFNKPGVHINSPRSPGSWSTSSLDSRKNPRCRPCSNRENICRKHGKKHKKSLHKKSKSKDSSSSSSSSSEEDIKCNLSSFADLNRPRPKCCVDKDSCWVKQKCLSEERCDTPNRAPVDLNLFQYEPVTTSLDSIPLPVSFPAHIPSPSGSNCPKCIKSDLCRKNCEKHPKKYLDQVPVCCSRESDQNWAENSPEKGPPSTQRDLENLWNPQETETPKEDPENRPDSQESSQPTESNQRTESNQPTDKVPRKSSAPNFEHMIKNRAQQIFISSPRSINLKTFELDRKAPKIITLNEPKRSSRIPQRTFIVTKLENQKSSTFCPQKSSIQSRLSQERPGTECSYGRPISSLPYPKYSPRNTKDQTYMGDPRIICRKAPIYNYEDLLSSRKRKRVRNSRARQESFSDLEARSPSIMYFNARPTCSRPSAELNFKASPVCPSRAPTKRSECRVPVRNYNPKTNCPQKNSNEPSSQVLFLRNINEGRASSSPRSSILKKDESGPSNRSVSFQLDKRPSNLSQNYQY